VRKGCVIKSQLRAESHNKIQCHDFCANSKICLAAQMYGSL